MCVNMHKYTRAPTGPEQSQVKQHIYVLTTLSLQIQMVYKCTRIHIQCTYVRTNTLVLNFGTRVVYFCVPFMTNAGSEVLHCCHDNILR